MLDDSELAVSTSWAMNRNGPAGKANPEGAGADVGSGAGRRGAVEAFGVVMIERAGIAGADAGGCGFFPKSHNRIDIVTRFPFLKAVLAAGRFNRSLSE